MDAKKVGILGTGVVGDTLAAGFAGRGHDVRQGGRTAFADVAAHGDVVVLALRGEVVEEVARSLAEELKGKLVLDTTNPLAYGEHGPQGLFLHGPESLGQRVQGAAPEARVVKCFNIIGAGGMVDPSFTTGDATMFIAGDDPPAKEQTRQLLQTLGWRSVADVGEIEQAWLLEALAWTWISIGVRTGGWDHALALLRG